MVEILSDTSSTNQQKEYLTLIQLSVERLLTAQNKIDRVLVNR